MLWKTTCFPAVCCLSSRKSFWSCCLNLNVGAYRLPGRFWGFLGGTRHSLNCELFWKTTNNLVYLPSFHKKTATIEINEAEWQFSKHQDNHQDGTLYIFFSSHILRIDRHISPWPRWEQHCAVPPLRWLLLGPTVQHGVSTTPAALFTNGQSMGPSIPSGHLTVCHGIDGP